MQLRNWGLAASSLAALCVAEVALAQEQAASAPADTTEIIVTAQKRNQRLQDVPMSVTAVEGSSLVEQNLLTAKDYAARIPGLTIDTGTNKTSGIAIRGITTGGGGNPTVAIVIDDIPFGGSGYAAIPPLPDIDPSDLAQLEVLRGPQGVLYGASNLGGLIKFVSKKADTKDWSGRVEGGVLAVHKGQEAIQGRASLNIPLATDVLGLRVSGFYREDPGYIDDTLIGKKDANRGRAYGGRASLSFTPTDRLNFNLSALYQNLKSDEPGFVELGPDFRPATAALGAGFEGRELTQAIATSNSLTEQRFYSLRADYEFDFASLTSLTGYGESRFNQLRDTTAQFDLALQSFGFAAGTISTLADTVKTDKFSQEIRLSSAGSGKVEWMIGGFYTNEQSKVNQLGIAQTAGGPSVYYVVEGPSDYEEIAGFANLTYKVSDRFDLQVGGRYAHNKQHLVEAADGLLNGGASVHDGRSSDNAFTWLVTPRFRINDSTMAYVRVATGYRPGGPISAAPGVPADFFDPDKTITYDFGVKGDLLDRLLSYDVALYWIDWSDIQLSLSTPTGFSYYANGGKARSRGIEGSLSLKPWAGMVLGGNFNINEAKLRDPLPSGSNFGLDGDRLPFTARFSGAINVDQSWDIEDNRASVGVSLTYVGNRLAAFPISSAVPRMPLPDYTSVDLRAGIRNSSGWGANLFARNLLDSRGWTTGQLRTRGNAGGGYRAYVIQPRTIGLNISKEF